jgi:hypothetical protein
MLYTITLNEIARELRLSRAACAVQLRQLMKANRFPQPLPGHADLWSRHLVGMWFRTNGGLVVQQPVAANDGGAEDPVAAHRLHLEHKLGIAHEQ